MKRNRVQPLRRLAILIKCFALLACVVMGHQAYTNYTANQHAALSAQRAFLLYPANHPAIVQACQTMLATPTAFPQPSGNAFPTGMPPALATIGASSVSITPNEGVLIMFDRRFGLWVTPPNSAATNLPISTAHQLTPDLWYLTYPGH